MFSVTGAPLIVAGDSRSDFLVVGTYEQLTSREMPIAVLERR